MAAAAPATAAAERPRIVSVVPAAPALLDRALELQVMARGGDVQGVRLSFPDLQGTFMESACRLPGGRVRSSAAAPAAFTVPYRPSWTGLHLLELAVTSGGCAGEQGVSRRSIPVEVAPEEQPADVAATSPAAAGPAPARDSARRGRCPGADLLPLRGRIRRLRLAVVCLVNAERTARGLRSLRTNAVLRGVASRHVHAMVRGGWFGHAGPRTPGLRARLRAAGGRVRGAGEALGSAPGRLGTPRSMVSAWMASGPIAGNLLDPSLRAIGVAAGVKAATPLPRSGGTYAVEMSG